MIITKKYWLLSLLTVLLLWLSYHPANQGWLIWIALAPWLVYVYIENNTRHLLFFSWLSGFMFFLMGLWWLRFVTLPGLIVVSFILGLYFLLFAWLSKMILRKFGDNLYYLSIPLLWVFLEMARAYVATGFPWFLLGHTQYQWQTLIQITDITGVYGISFLIAAVNSYILFILVRRVIQKIPRRQSRPQVILWGLVILVLGLAVLIYGHFRIKSLQFKSGPKIGIVQANIEQSLKLNRNRGSEIYDKHLNLSLQLTKEKPDLIVWAETMFPYLVRVGSESLEYLKETVRMCQTDMIIGSVSDDAVSSDDLKLYNSAYFISAQGEILGRYDKTHLVPVSEALPLRDTLPWLEKVVLSLSELKRLPTLNPGKNLQPFQWHNYKFGILICYESIFPELNREMVRQGSQFIINISNDGWFRDGAELEQILAISVFRAVENKIGFIRATNTGISAFISPLGKMNILKNSSGQYKEISGAMLGQVDIGGEQTFYTSRGDYFPIICLLGLCIIIFYKIIKINLTKN